MIGRRRDPGPPSPRGARLARRPGARSCSHEPRRGSCSPNRFVYDLAGNRTSEKLKDPSGTLQHEIQAAYDTRNRLSELNDGGSLTDILFDAAGQLTSQTDPNTHDTSFTYDLLGRLATQIDALSGVTDFDYQANDAVSQLTAPNSVATGTATDDLGNPVSETSPDRGTITTTADSAGNIVTVTGFGAGTFTYDALNRPLLRNYSGVVQDVAFSYDSCPNGTGRVCSIDDEFSITSFEYDAFGNVVHKTDTGGGNTYHTTYSWDADDRLTQITYPTGHIVVYTRDAQGRIQGVTLDGASVVSNRTYRGDGKLTGQTYGNGLVETRSYNSRSLLDTYTLGSIESESYGYDAAGNLTSRSGSSWTLGYGYDALDRVTSDVGGSGSRGYGYDANGNRLTKTVDGSPTSYTYTTGTNRLATVGGSSIGSDSLGRITSVPGYTYTYSAANRLQSVQQGGVTVASYAYDHRGLRRRKSTGFMGFNTTVYHYDEAGHLLAETNQVAGTVVLYVWADDSPVAQKAGSVLTYLHADHLDTPRWGTNAVGALVWRWKSDGFGEALPEEDVDGDTIAVRVNLRFPGQFYDAESGLHQNWMRDYTPGYGRYAQADPIGLAGGLNTYGYASANPVQVIDPSGEGPITLGVCLLIGGVTTAIQIADIFEANRDIQETKDRIDALVEEMKTCSESRNLEILEEIEILKTELIKRRYRAHGEGQAAAVAGLATTACIPLIMIGP
jgi:RHS repeat-associated protein